MDYKSEAVISFEAANHRLCVTNAWLGSWYERMTEEPRHEKSLDTEDKCFEELF